MLLGLKGNTHSVFRCGGVLGAYADLTCIALVLTVVVGAV